MVASDASKPKPKLKYKYGLRLHPARHDCARKARKQVAVGRRRAAETQEEQVARLNTQNRELREHLKVERLGRKRDHARTEKVMNRLIEEEQRRLRDRLREGEENFSLRSGYSLALRLAASGVAAAALGIAAGVDCHGSTVGRWLKKFRGGDLAAIREFLVRQYMRLEKSSSSAGRRKRGVRFVIHVVRGDATSANVWHRQKLHVTLVRSIFSHFGLRRRWLARTTLPRASVTNKLKYFCKSLKVKQAMAELLAVRDKVPGDPEGGIMMAVLEKQVKSVGCRTWHKPALDVLALPPPPQQSSITDSTVLEAGAAAAPSTADAEQERGAARAPMQLRDDEEAQEDKDVQMLVDEEGEGVGMKSSATAKQPDQEEGDIGAADGDGDFLAFDEEERKLFNELYPDPGRAAAGGEEREDDFLRFDPEERKLFNALYPGRAAAGEAEQGTTTSEKSQDEEDDHLSGLSNTADSESAAPLRPRRPARPHEEKKEATRRRRKRSERDRAADAPPHAAAVAAAVEAELSRLGLLSSDEEDAAPVEEGDDSDSEAEEGEGVIHIWLLTSDAGGDIRAAKVRIETEVERLSAQTENEAVMYLFLSMDCLLHQYHIVAKEQLHVMDHVAASLGLRERREKAKKKVGAAGAKAAKEEKGPSVSEKAEQPATGTKNTKSKKTASFAYYSNLAKLQHTWRELSAKIYNAWVAEFGLKDAMECAGRIPPQPISGRWGRASDVELFLLLTCAKDCRTAEDVATILDKAARVRAVFRRVMKPEDMDDDDSSSSEEELADLDHPTAQAERKRAEEAEAAGEAPQAKAKAKAAAKPKAKAKSGAWSVDEIRVEDQETYSRKMGKWRRSAWRTLLHAEEFFLAVAVGKATRGKLDRLLYTIQKKRPHPSAQALARLVWSKGALIREGIEGLLEEGRWDAITAAADAVKDRRQQEQEQQEQKRKEEAQEEEKKKKGQPQEQPEEGGAAAEGGEAPRVPGAPGAAPATELPQEKPAHPQRRRRSLRTGILFHIERLVRRMLANYERRVMQRLNSPPANLLWLAAGAPDFPIPQRAALAEDLRSLLRNPAEAAWANPAAVLIAKRFPMALEECARSGGSLAHDSRLWLVFRTIAAEWKADTQELESMMNSIKMIIDACPAMREPALDARLAAMKAFREKTEHKPRAKMRFTRDVRPALEDMVEEVIDANAHSVLKRIDRFVPPAACLRAPEPHPSTKSKMVLVSSTKPALKWANAWNTSWKEVHKRSIESMMERGARGELEVLAICDAQPAAEGAARATTAWATTGAPAPAPAVEDRQEDASAAAPGSITDKGEQERPALSAKEMRGEGESRSTTALVLAKATATATTLSLREEGEREGTDVEVRSCWLLGTVFDKSGHFWRAEMVKRPSGDNGFEFSVEPVEPRVLVSSLEVLASMYENPHAVALMFPLQHQRHALQQEQDSGRGPLPALTTSGSALALRRDTAPAPVAAAISTQLSTVRAPIRNLQRSSAQRRLQLPGELLVLLPKTEKKTKKKKRKQQPKKKTTGSQKTRREENGALPAPLADKDEEENDDLAAPSTPSLSSSSSSSVSSDSDEAIQAILGEGQHDGAADDDPNALFKDDDGKAERTRAAKDARKARNIQKEAFKEGSAPPGIEEAAEELVSRGFDRQAAIVEAIAASSILEGLPTQKPTGPEDVEAAAGSLSGANVDELSDDWELGLRNACEALEALARYADLAVEDEEMRLAGQTSGRSQKLSLCQFRSSVVSESPGTASAMVVRLVQWVKFNERKGAVIRLDDEQRVLLRNLGTEQQRNKVQELQMCTVLVANTGVECARDLHSGGGVQRALRWKVPAWVLWLKRCAEVRLQNGIDGCRQAPPERIAATLAAAADAKAEGEEDSEEEADGFSSFAQTGHDFASPMAPCAFCRLFASKRVGDSVRECPLCGIACHMSCREAAVAVVRSSPQELVDRCVEISLPAFLADSDLCALCDRDRVSFRSRTSDSSAGEGIQRKRKRGQQRSQQAQEEGGSAEDAARAAALALAASGEKRKQQLERSGRGT